jgi:iron complex outermembrane recepter protein
MKSLLPALLAGCAFVNPSFAQDPQQSDLATPEVVVTATRFEDTFADKPVSVTVISSEEIRRSPARTVPDLLSGYPGIGGRDLFGNNGAQASVDMRGFGAAASQNTLILVDGRRQNDIDISGVQWSSIPLDFVERIEVVRGGGSVLYGDGAVSGVINIITRKPGLDGNRASATLGAGSYDTYSARADGELAGKDAGLRVGASYYDSHGYRDNNENTQSAAFADARWQRDRDELSLRFSGANQDLRLPGGRAVQPGIGENLLETDRRGATTPKDYATRDDASLQFDWTRSGEAVTGIVGVSYRLKDQTSYFDFGGFPDYREVDLDVFALTPRVRIDHASLGVAGNLVLGFDWYYWDYRLDQASSPGAIGQPIHRVRGEQQNRAIYLQETMAPTSTTTVMAGARMEWFSIDATDTFDPAAPNPSFINGGSPQGGQNERQHALELGVRQAIGERWSGYVRGSRAFRFATVDELYEGSSSFSQEFQFLQPQTSETYEVGMEWRVVSASVRAGVFRTDLKDEIHLDPFSFGTGNTNMPESRREGFEIEATARPTTQLDLRLAYTYTDAQFKEGAIGGTSVAGKTVPLVARHRASVAAGFRFTDALRLDAVASYVSSQYMENDEENAFGTRIPEYTVTDLRLAYEWRRAVLALTVNNLFDEQYYNYAVTSIFTPGRYSAYPLPERNAFLELKIRLGD